MRIGIWCDYGFTLEPSEGIGVFVDNLARGLVQAEDSLELLLVPHPGQERVLDPTVAAGRGRIHVAQRSRLSRWRRQAIRQCRKLRRATLPRTKPDSSWLERLDSAVARVVAGLEVDHQIQTQTIIDSCDLWLLPYVGLEQRFSKPTIVIVHDLVSYHFPSVMKPAHLRQLKWQVDRQIQSAGRVACMSNFIRDRELYGELGLPADRVSVVSPAVPDEIGVQPTVAPTLPSVLSFDEPYLFYPAAFRTYKNHELLVKLIPRLKQSALWPMKVVFTGIRRCPSWLRSLIVANEAQDDVVILGKVTRGQLVSIYQRAFATVVPSLYEQGSFPALESLQWRCPVAVADIPPLREQFASMGEEMLYFDPHDVSALFAQIESIAGNRADVVVRQQKAFCRLRERSWTTAAREWLTTFEQVARENRNSWNKVA